jgi:N-acetylated-alpha-linked acidic dipeptidase
MQNKGFSFALMLALTIFAGVQKHPSSERILGFSPQNAQKQREIEEIFKRIPSPQEARRQHRYFTAEPHPAGSERNNELAHYIADQWKRQGWDEVKMHRYDVLVSFPREIAVEMVTPVRYRAGLREDSYDVDPDTKNPNVRGAYLSLSASGEVTAPVVYAHGGNPEDYEVLRQNGIDVRGKIVLVRYSNPYSYRGFKALTAERLGAAGMLIYSDPAEDGFARGKVFPGGPWGPASHIQRGAITYDFMVAGDPLTPGWASVPGAKLLAKEEAISLPKIMAVPLSWRDAKPLLENMGGPRAPKAWQGALPIKYRLGGTGRVHLKVAMETSLKPNYVVEARIRGALYPDEWVLVANHRDAWEFGGVDPSSGTASMMELTRALGEIVKLGHRPQRTLIACSWDGEEVGLTGSTEWGEQFADELKQKLVAYLNVDSSTSGPDFDGEAVASFAPMLVEASQSLTAPSGKTLYEEWRRSQQQAKRKPVTDDELVNTRIGSGSDHTVFLNHLGRPVFNLSFEGPYGVYHSMYDNHYWMNHFGDPGFHYHILMARLWGVLALRLANAQILPIDCAVYADHIRRFIMELRPKAGSQVDFRSVIKRVEEFGQEGERLKQAIARRLASDNLKEETAARVNRLLMMVESNWLNQDGIPGRPWFKHILYAARFTYAHLELPGLTEAIENGNWDLAAEQARILEQALARNASLIREAGNELESSQSNEK